MINAAKKIIPAPKPIFFEIRFLAFQNYCRQLKNTVFNGDNYY